MQLDLVEEDYFGLQFMDKNQVPHWLDKTKKIKKQIQGMLFRTSFIFMVFVFVVRGIIADQLDFKANNRSSNVSLSGKILHF